MRISPIEIQQRQFKTRLVGYDTSAVDQFLEQVADEMERLHKISHTQKEELARMRKQLDEMQQREKALQETLVTVKQVSDDMRETAKKDAEIIVAEGHIQGERIIRSAEERQLALIRDIQELKGQKVAFETGLRALIENHMKLLDMSAVPIDGIDSELIEDQKAALANARIDTHNLLKDIELP